MKLVIAKIVYWVGIVALIGVGIATLTALLWFVITTIPFFLAIMAGFVVLIGFGMLFGWAENQIEQAKRYDLGK